MEASCQRQFDNPKDQDEWEIYPPPPAPSWPLPPPEELQRRKERELKREADPVGFVGSDFDISHCKMPETDQVSYLQLCHLCLTIFSSFKLSSSMSLMTPAYFKFMKARSI
jgi:AMP deaminase